MVHEGLAHTAFLHYTPGPQSISPNAFLSYVLRQGPFFQLLVRICFPESPTESTSNVSYLASPYVHDFQ